MICRRERPTKIYCGTNCYMNFCIKDISHKIKATIYLQKYPNLFPVQNKCLTGIKLHYSILIPGGRIISILVSPSTPPLGSSSRDKIVKCNHSLKSQFYRAIHGVKRYFYLYSKNLSLTKVVYPTSSQ